MLLIGLALLAGVNLGGGFGEASAEIMSISSEEMNIRIEVDVQSTASSVVVHLVAPGEPDLTLPLLAEGGPVYALQTDLRPIDYVVVFEAIGEVSVMSQPVSLSDLGAQFLPDPTTTTAASEGIPGPVQRWGWLALALAAASLSLLAFWVLGARDEPEGTEIDQADIHPAGDSG